MAPSPPSPRDREQAEQKQPFDARRAATAAAGRRPGARRDGALGHDRRGFGIDGIPLLAASYDQAKQLSAASKPAIEKKHAAQGIVVLFAVPWAPQGIYAKKDINTVDDMKGLKWRAYNVGTARIADLVGAQPVTIQAAELPQALATGVVNAFMTSAATGYDSKAWETMTHFYDVQAWIPKNVTFMNKAAFEQLDKPTQETVLKVAAAAEARGWWRSQDKTKWFTEQLTAVHGIDFSAHPPPKPELLISYDA